MNEITQIHLSRQQFTISIAAHHELKAYLADIRKKVGDEEVANEIESRMSELLLEHGVTGEKVVLPADIAYLKDQLGLPEDFDDEGAAAEPEEKQKADGDRRLFRDTDNALIAGAGAGLANYFGLDVILVRLAIVVLTLFSFGTSIIIYVILWVVVPPATTASEKLQMHGKPVTLEAIRESVSKADVSKTARRFNRSLLSVIDSIFRAATKLAGIGFVLLGTSMLAGAAVTRLYMSLHNGRLIQENLFPVTTREQLLVWIVLGLVCLLSFLSILAGVAIFKRKWLLRGWATGVLAVIFLVGSVAAVGLAADAVPHVRDRYEAGLHTTAIKNIQPFNKVQVNDIDISYVSSPTYAVNLHYFDQPDLSKIKVHIADHTLFVDASALNAAKHCTMLCAFPHYNLTVQIYAPNVEDFKTPPHTDIFYPAPPPLN
jgi:phage shock protein PspC (stress-responsive transcriptional regulator)